MDSASLRTWWWRAQALDGSLAGADPATVLERTGWARSVGGANPYLTLFARAGTDRAAIDAAVARLEIHELPTARGCTYVVPAAHYALALQVGRGAAEGELRVLEKLGVDRSEVDKVCAAVLEVAGDTPLDPAQLKDELGGVVRNLGEEGRKRGQTTTLPAALGLLQAAGAIRRVPVNGRLDQQRYGYVRWQAPVTGHSPRAAKAELARLYFGWTGPATLAHFRWFSAFSAADAKTAVADAGLVDAGDGFLVLPDNASAPAPSRKAAYSLLASIDALFLLRRELAPLLEPADAERTLIGERPLGRVPDLEHHGIVDRGRIVGLWEYDGDAGRVVWLPFEPPTKALRDAVARTESYVRDQLGDARSFSLDSVKSRAPRIAALRAAGAEG
jgi:hypothetical protein